MRKDRRGSAVRWWQSDATHIRHGPIPAHDAAAKVMIQVSTKRQIQECLAYRCSPRTGLDAGGPQVDHFVVLRVDASRAS